MSTETEAWLSRTLGDKTAEQPRDNSSLGEGAGSLEATGEGDGAEE